MIRWIIPAVVFGLGVYLAFFGIAVDKGANARIGPIRAQMARVSALNEVLLREHRCVVHAAADACRGEIDAAEAAVRATPPG
jgi:hypothetical protein